MKKRLITIALMIILITVTMSGCEQILNVSGVQINSWTITENNTLPALNLSLDVTRVKGAYISLQYPSGTTSDSFFLPEGKNYTISFPIATYNQRTPQPGTYTINAYDADSMKGQEPQKIHTTRIDLKGPSLVFENWNISYWNYQTNEGYSIGTLALTVTNNGDLPTQPDIYAILNDTPHNLSNTNMIYPGQEQYLYFYNTINDLNLTTYEMTVYIDNRSTSITKLVTPCENVQFSLHSWEVHDLDGNPCLTLEYKISDNAGIHLLNPSGESIDSLQIQKEETTVDLYLNGNDRQNHGYYYTQPGANKIPATGTYTIKVGKYIKTFTFTGPAISIMGMTPDWYYPYFLGVYTTSYLNTLTLRIANDGDLPAYLASYIILSTTGHEFGVGTINPYSEKNFTIDTYSGPWGNGLGGGYFNEWPGTYNLTVDIRYYSTYESYRTLATYSERVTITTPE